jgi:hypothetical protein
MNQTKFSKMNNVEIFNELVLRIFDHLYDRFPVPCSVKPEEFIAELNINSPRQCPVNSKCGPNISTEEWIGVVNQVWIDHNWDETEAEVESKLGRKLTIEEKEKIRLTGHRPFTVEEEKEKIVWEEEQKLFESINLIFKSTLQFLINENLIRYIDLVPVNEGEVLNPSDILIAMSLGRLSFVLTSRGFTHLNKAFKKGILTKEITVFEAVKKCLKEKSINPLMEKNNYLNHVVVQSIVTSVLQ